MLPVHVTCQKAVQVKVLSVHQTSSKLLVKSVALLQDLAIFKKRAREEIPNALQTNFRDLTKRVDNLLDLVTLLKNVQETKLLVRKTRSCRHQLSAETQQGIVTYLKLVQAPMRHVQQTLS